MFAHRHQEKDGERIPVRSKNERVELEMKILRYRRLAKLITDEQALARIKELISGLERELRAIDE
jgi:hypothetical protein